MSLLWYISGVIVMLFIVTMVTRGLPFVFGDWIRKRETLMALGEQLPAAIILMLIIYYVMMLGKQSHWHNLVWQIIALIITLILQYHFRKTILSLVAGTVIYLVLQGLF